MIIQGMYERVWRFTQDMGDDEIFEIRQSIIDLLAENVRQPKNRLGYWEKEHISAAVEAFKENVTRQNGTIWLRLCLVCLEKAFVTPDDRSEYQWRMKDEVAALTFDDLIEQIEQLRGLVH